ncbi:MAG: hypothetical protein ACP5N3_04165 [Candidatus Nanoarchaeia archaeon]
MVNFQKKMNDVLMSQDFQGGIDINSLVNTTQPPEFILKLLMIQHREDVHSALDTYMRQKAQGIKPDISKFKARLFSMFIQIRASLKVHFKEDFDAIEKTILTSKDFDELYKIFCTIEDYLLLKGVIKFDNLPSIQMGDIEALNSSKGYY